MVVVSPALILCPYGFSTCCFMKLQQSLLILRGDCTRVELLVQGTNRFVPFSSNDLPSPLNWRIMRIFLNVTKCFGSVFNVSLSKFFRNVSQCFTFLKIFPFAIFHFSENDSLSWKCIILLRRGSNSRPADRNQMNDRECKDPLHPVAYGKLGFSI